MKTAAFLLLLCACGASTEFKGAAKIEGGPTACKAVCEKWGMELVGMVQMGDYSNGCICQVKGLGQAAPAAAGAGAAAAGVMMQEDQQRSIPTTPAPMGTH